MDTKERLSMEMNESLEQNTNAMVGTTINPIGRLLTNIVNVFFFLVVGSLILRFLLKLLGANSANNLVHFVYIHTQPLIDPFSGIFSFPVPSFQIGVIEITVVVALGAYLFLAGIISKVIDTFFG